MVWYHTHPQALHTTALSALTEALRALPEVAVSDSDRGRFLEAANSVASGAGDRRCDSWIDVHNVSLDGLVFSLIICLLCV